MAKAQIRTPEGITVNVEGTPGEITKVVENLKKDAAAKASKKDKGSGARRVAPQGKVTATTLLATLIEEDFFKQGRDLAGVSGEFAARGHPMKHTLIAPALLRAVRKGTLRRSKKDGQWIYNQR